MITILQFLYLFGASVLALYTLGQAVLLVSYFLHNRRNPPLPSVEQWPLVAIQLPIYNEIHVVTRLLRAVAALDYPRDRLLVQVLDDSTDSTSQRIGRQVTALRRQGLNIDHVQRVNRVGYKAGALDYGLGLLRARGDVELVAIFDADFVPPRDFLRKTVPYMVADPKLGIVQTRWGHLNAEENPITRAQALMIDAHFIIEQTARNRAGLLLTFNGTGGLWRVRSIDEAGGWSADTLTEDLDLSYRAQMAGWGYLFLPDIVVPGEVPPQMEAYKRQQARWAKGSDQTLFKLLPRVWRAHLTLGQRLMALQHLGQYLPHPIMLVLLLIAPPLIAAHRLDDLPLAPLGIIGLIPPLMHAVTQMRLHRDWPRRLLVFPVVMLLGAGMTWNNSRAAYEALRSHATGTVGEFKRTPKFGRDGTRSSYALGGDWSAWVEIGLALYTLIGVGLAIQYRFTGLVPFLGLYAVSLAMVGICSLHERHQLSQQRPALQIESATKP